MSRTYTIELTDVDLFQALDGLEIRAEAWEKTAHYLEHGELLAGEVFIVEECSRADEAEQIAEHYRKIIRKIRAQMREFSDEEP